MKTLVLTTNDINKEIIKPDGKFNPIITKAADINALAFKTIDEKKMNDIVKFMPEVNRAVSVFSKQNSQTTSSLMVLGMLESGPYRVLRQILAQIEKKRTALKESVFELEEKKLEYDNLIEKLKKLTTEDLPNRFEERKMCLKRDKIVSDIVDATVYIEAALKELGAYQERYKEVCKNNNIPKQWDEEDFEQAEVEHHIKAMFRNAIRDRMQGTHNQGTMEYFSQFGINSTVAYILVDEYLISIKQAVNDGLKANKLPTIDVEYEFYDRMYFLFKNEYKRAMKRLGLDSINYADWLMKENK
jgi:hypothetical protein